MTTEAESATTVEQGPRDHLRTLVADQKAENKRFDFDQPKIFTSEQLISEFRATEGFVELDLEARQVFSAPHDEEELAELQHRFAGGLFEGLAYLQLAQTETDGKVLLSTSRTSSLFQALYSDEEEYPRMKDPFGKISIKGISVPDGVFVEEDNDGQFKIVSICEYKAGMSGKHNPRNSSLNNSLSLLKIGRDELPDVFSQEASLLIVSLSNSVLPINRGYSMRGSNEVVELIGLPFDNVEYRGIVDTFLAPYNMPHDLLNAPPK